MTASNPQPSARHPNGKGGKFIPALCNLLGTLILLFVLTVCLPLTLPRLLGYEVYDVVSGSMSPAIPVGSVIYVKPVPPEDVLPGDVIAFRSEGAVVTHRVAENLFVEGSFVTKGDANETEDFDRVGYRDFIGTVTGHFPAVGRIMAVYADGIGKLYLLCLAACGVMFHLLAARIRTNREEERRLLLARAEMLQAKERSAGEGNSIPL